jgi:hypothetical protein
MDKLTYQIFEFIGEGKNLWRELSNEYPAHHIVSFDFEEQVFKPDQDINEADLQLANEYSSKLNDIVKAHGIKIINKEVKGF